jgi:hypothetical protein
MAYIGNTPAEKYVSLSAQHFTVTATANYTLSNSVTNENEIALFINNVRQRPGGSYAYTAVGTTLTLSAATAGTDTMYCVYLGKAVGTISPPDNSVNSAKIVDGSVTSTDIASLAATKITGTIDSGQIAAGSVDLAHMSAESVDSDQYVDGSIDTIHIGDDQVTGAKLNPALVAGDIIYADGTDTINRLAKPASPANEVLTFATSATAPSWVAPAAGGKLLQIVSVNKTDTFGSTSPVTPEDVTGMSVTITPSATSSKIWLTVSVAYAGSASNDTYFRILKGSTLIAMGDTAGSRSRCWFELPRSNSSVMSGAACLTFLDSPSTTSATTYKL